MSETYYIVDEELPLSQNFKLLKEEGLSLIQTYTGNEWTNFNPSDPGITILDQLCYAFTELGYCNDFPVKDILTSEKEKLIVHEQFFLPDSILTTSPVTITDYRKFIIDGVAGVRNVHMVPVSTESIALEGVYSTYISWDASISEIDEVLNLCYATFYLLNTARNLTEGFLVPRPLQLKYHELSGRIDINSTGELQQILVDIQNTISDAIFPSVPQYGYSELRDMGEATNAIMEGPKLKNGWIREQDLGIKKDCLRLVEVNHLLQSIDNVSGVSQLSFGNDTDDQNGATSQDYELLTFNIIELATSKTLSFFCNNKEVDSDALQQAISFAKRDLKSPKKRSSVGAVKLKPNLPKGTYRDINSYYSIQNTFPQIYPVGQNAVSSNASNLQQAQSRQLKGYLTLFDQVLANQFSQLDNIHRLFSFKNSTTGTPSDRRKFYDLREEFEKKHPGYPVPYSYFAPTYFYQSLYDVPNIWHLLKDDHTFDFNLTPENDKQKEDRSWKAFKGDPYNPYMWGLMNFVATDKENYHRRNRLLDHLLARHGESPDVIDALIEESNYTSDTLRDKIIFKSIYLQNLQPLSYYRLKGYNYLAADEIEFKFDEKRLKSAYDKFRKGITKDFIFRSEEVDRLEKVRRQFLIYYTTFELKMNLLFGLREIYTRYYLEFYGKEGKEDDMKLALWFIECRKGMICIETNLLFLPANFEIAIIPMAAGEGEEYLVSELNFGNATRIGAWLYGASKDTISNSLADGIITVEGIQYDITTSVDIDYNPDWFTLTADKGYSVAVKVDWGGDTETYIGDPVFNSSIDLFFPNFASEFQTPVFTQKLQTLVENATSVQTGYTPHCVDTSWLMAFIPKYICWHNGIRFKEKKADEVVSAVGPKQWAGAVAKEIIAIHTDTNE